jgi:predicted enzyme related to lactoylglutathione lyase
MKANTQVNKAKAKSKAAPKNKTKEKPKTKKTQKKEEFLSWYEIPATNLERAVSFYSSIFNIEFETTHTGVHTMAFFPAELGVGGALVFGDGCIPSQTGSLVYLNAGPSLDEPLSKIQSSGGQILMGKTFISNEAGFYALVLDSEGNRLALCSKA